jgi:hypothetical protein
VSHLQDDDIEVGFSIPPRNGKLTVQMAERLIKSSIYDGRPPDKVVVLVDLDGKDPDQELLPFKEDLPGRLRDQIESSIQYAYAQWHLEAWYFGDAEHLRGYLGGKALGNVDTSQPDAIQNPKLHLKHLLERSYTARVSEEIAMKLDPRTIAQRSRSFAYFLDAVRNGGTLQAIG